MHDNSFPGYYPHQQPHDVHHSPHVPNHPEVMPSFLREPTSSFPEPPAETRRAQSVMPQPMVQVLSPRGVEYVFLTIALFTGAFGLAGSLIALVNGNIEIGMFPVASLVVATPVFSLLFLNLKRTELRDPSLRFDASKRRSTQLIQIASFLVAFFTFIGFLTTIFAQANGKYEGSLLKLTFDAIIILAIAGGILAYYWHDEHRQG